MKSTPVDNGEAARSVPAEYDVDFRKHFNLLRTLRGCTSFAPRYSFGIDVQDHCGA